MILMKTHTATQRLDTKKFLRYPFSNFPETVMTNYGKELHMKETVANTLGVPLEKIHVFACAISADGKRGSITVWNPHYL